VREFFRNFMALHRNITVAAVSDFLVDTVVVRFDDFNSLLAVVDFAHTLLEELAL
jgi:hypothetical protein